MTKAMVAVVIVLGLAAAGAQEAPRRTHLVIVVDGLRPDYVTPEVMPRLTALGQRGIVFTRAPFGLSDRHPRQRVLFRDRRVSRSAWADGQHHLRSARERNQDPRYREAREPGRCRACRRTAAHVAHAQRAASTRGQVAARREQRVERRDAAPEPHARDRRHRPLRVQPPPRARGGGRPDPRTAPAAATPNDGRNQYAVDAYIKMALEQAASRCDVHVDQRSGWNGALERHRLRSDAEIADAGRQLHRAYRGRAAGEGTSGSHEHHRHVRPRILDPYRRAEAGRPRPAVRPADARRITGHRRRRRRDSFPGGRRCCSSRGGRYRASEAT